MLLTMNTNVFSYRVVLVSSQIYYFFYTFTPKSVRMLETTKTLLKQMFLFLVVGHWSVSPHDHSDWLEALMRGASHAARLPTTSVSLVWCKDSQPRLRV